MLRLIRQTSIKNSIYKRNSFVYGKTDEKEYLDKNYINLNFKNQFLKSNSKSYIKIFLNQEKINKSDIIELFLKEELIKGESIEIELKYSIKLHPTFFTKTLQLNFNIV